MALHKKEYPILEFDTDRSAVIEPHLFYEKGDAPRHCVITFFREVIERKRAEGSLTQIAELGCEMLKIPIYETVCEGKRICLVQGFVGSAGAAAFLEELIAFGCGLFMVCGGAGVLRPDIAVGHLMVPYTAVRDEGVSYHYIEPSREISCDPGVVDAVERELTRSSIPYIKAKTWTTDAFYRETRDKVALRVSEGCVCVEMEAAAFFAVAQFRGVRLGQVLYGGDDLSGEAWDGREWNDRTDVRENLVDLSMKICLRIRDYR